MATRRTKRKNGRKKLPLKKQPTQRGIFDPSKRKFVAEKVERTRHGRPSKGGTVRSDPDNSRRAANKKISRYMRVIRSTRRPSHGPVKKRLSYFNVRYLAEKVWKEQVCKKRKERREQLFKDNKIGKGKGGPKNRRSTIKTLVRC